MKNFETAVVGLTAAALLAGCGPAQERPDEGPATGGASVGDQLPAGESGGQTIYVETWNEQAPAQLGALQLQGSGVNIDLAFGIPQSDGSVVAPQVSDELAQAINTATTDSEVTLAIGGYGDDANADPAQHHDVILRNFEAAAEQPQVFADSLKNATQQLGDRLGHAINNVEIDWEYPSAGEGAKLAAVIEAVHDAMPDVGIGLAVPAGFNTEGFQEALPQIADKLKSVHVMTYDEHTVYDTGNPVGPVASRQWAVDGFHNWQNMIAAAGGDPSIAELGVATYCYAYDDATAYGDINQGGGFVQYSQLAGEQFTPQPDGSSILVKDGRLISCTTPDDVRRILAETGPGVKVFFWTVAGMTRDYLSAVK